MDENFGSAGIANDAHRAHRMSRDLNRIGRPISADRLEALLAGADPSEAELACLQALNRMIVRGSHARGASLSVSTQSGPGFGWW